MNPDPLASAEAIMLVVAFGRRDDTLPIFGPHGTAGPHSPERGCGMEIRGEKRFCTKQRSGISSMRRQNRRSVSAVARAHAVNAITHLDPPGQMSVNRTCETPTLTATFTLRFRGYAFT